MTRFYSYSILYLNIVVTYFPKGDLNDISYRLVDSTELPYLQVFQTYTVLHIGTTYLHFLLTSKTFIKEGERHDQVFECIPTKLTSFKLKVQKS